MESKIETRHVVVVELSVDEAYYLKLKLQNHNEENPYTEDLSDSKFRIAIFDRLPTFTQMEILD